MSFTEHETRNIKSLPTVRMKYGSRTIKAHVDMDNRKMYFVDDNNEPTGQIVEIKDEQQERIRKILQYAENNNISLEDPQAEPQAQVKPEQAETHDETGYLDVEMLERNMKRIRKAVMTCVFAVVAAILVLGSALAAQTLVMNQHSAAIRNVAEAISADTGKEKVSVVQLAHTVVPGEVLNQNMVREGTISVAEFNDFSADGNRILMWDAVEGLYGLAVAEYSTAGDFLRLDDVAATYQIPKSKWSADLEADNVFAVNAADITGNPFLGSKVTLKVVVRREQKAGEERLLDGVVDLRSAELEVNEEGIPSLTEELITEHALTENMIVAAQDKVYVVIKNEDALALQETERTKAFETVPEETAEEEIHITSENQYELEAVVCDIRNAAGNSLYTMLYPYTEVPEYERDIYFAECKKAVQTDFDKDDIKLKTVYVEIPEDKLTTIGNISDAEIFTSITDKSPDSDASALLNIFMKIRAAVQEEK